MEKIKTDSNKTHQYYIVLGDWSGDGHDKSEKILIETNVSLENLREAYIRSTNETNMSFETHQLFSQKVNFCTEYAHNILTKLMYETLIKYGCPINDMEIDGVGDDPITIDNCEDCYLYTDSFLNLLMWFISLSIEKDFKWKRVKDEIPCFNGHWGPLNSTIGYGLYE